MEPAITYPDLPITARRDELLAAIGEHQVVVVAGETGSGKSTQLPKLCLELGRGRRAEGPDGTPGNGGWIGHTQPRRIAARSIAERVAEELGGEVGGAVGYKVRFTDEVSPDTRIKVMTDGVLLAEIQRDRQLRRYDTLIVDEAHERSLNIDFLLGYLHQLLPKRPDLKLIITSATIDTARFSEHFGGAPVVEVEGRTYPVEMRYHPLDPPPGSDEPQRDQVEGIVDAVQELRRDHDGDVLVFCSGEREIRDAAAALEDAELGDTEIFPLFARLSAAEQHRVFEQHRGRRVVLATNVAETSLTVPGIRAVVDPGTARISRYSQRTKVQRLPIEAISQASANQRAGRCGRVGPGICIRLYSEDDYESRPEFTEPEIRRTNLASVILQMANIGLGDVASFPFVDPPADRNIRDGIALLEELGAVQPGRQGTRKWLTQLGRRLARLPIDPRLGRMVLEAGDNGCLHEVMVIAAAMSIQDPRERPFDHRAAADQSHARFAHPDSDFLTYLNLWNHLKAERKERTSSGFRRMCRQEFLNFNRIREWQDLYDQLRRAAASVGLKPNTVPAEADAVHLSLLAGLLSHIGMKDVPEDERGRGRGRDGETRSRERRASREFIGARQARFAIAPGSVLARKAPNWVMAGELVETNRLWARTAAGIDPAWAERLGDHLVKRSYGEPWWDRERGSALTHERVTLYGLTLAAGRRVQLGRVDPDLARDLFIHHALVLGEWGAQHKFMARNARVVEEAERLEARARRDLLADHHQIFDFYDARIPDDVTSAIDFDRWWKEERRTNGKLLDLTLDDLLTADAADHIDPHAFPEVWHVAGHDLPVTYEFDPLSEHDGATFTIDAGIVGQLDPASFDWNVPGFRDELVESLIRSLPKQLRKLFVPVPETVAEIRDGLGPEHGPVVESVRRELNKLITSPLPPDAFDLDKLPAHLRPTFRIVDGAGNELAIGKELPHLVAAVHAESAAIVAHVDLGLEQSGLRSWTFGDLPRSVRQTVNGREVTAYPALADDGDSVSIVACTGPGEQAATMWDGTRRLLRFQLPGPARQVDSLLGQRTKQAMSTSPIQAKVDWYHDIVNGALDHLIAQAGGPPWNEAGFTALVAIAREGMHDALVRFCRAAADVIELHTSVTRQLGRLTAPPMAAAAGDMAEHLDRLVYEGMLTGVGHDRLDDVLRYLRALLRRAEHLGDNVRRDTELMERCRRLEAEYEQLADTVSASDELEAVAWQLEELRVSLFAQQLGTPAPVSEKRIRKEMLRIARGQ